MIDATVVDHVQDKHQAIGVMSTLGLFMVNAISADMVNGSNLYTEGCLGQNGERENQGECVVPYRPRGRP